MKIDIITIFPKQVSSFLSEGIFRISREKGIEVMAHDLRLWASGTQRKVDDRPFGGGPGMVMKVEPVYRAVSDLRSDDSTVILTSPRGTMLTAPLAQGLAKENHVLIICGHYEGVDERVRQHIADMDISIGEYVLSGGELPALVITDALLRHVSGVLGNPASLTEESFEGDIGGEYPHYTRPETFRGWSVPGELLSGNHETIRRWRKNSIST